MNVDAQKNIHGNVQRVSYPRNRKDHRLILRSILFLFPACSLLLVFFVGPILLTFYFAFTNMSLTGTAAQAIEFVGFKNFMYM
ncbi:sugar ABC transporter permease, partial [Geobacillus thermodenitrificans]|nr:sugar ABC transporter permease [Geobacillus thermodenitrificans]